MLTKRIIPCLDVKNGRVVKGVKFLSLKDAGDPVKAALYYDRSGADELVFLDITASHEKRKTMIKIVRKTAEKVFMPLTVGGGVSTLEDIKNLLRAGADKVSLNTAAIEKPGLIREAAERFGSQCVVVAIDAKRHQKIKNKWEVYTHGGRTNRGLDAVEWAKKAEKFGAGEILLTSMDRDGTKKGYDLSLLRKVSEAVKIPVIASGGVGSLKDLADGFIRGKADAALAASIFHFKTHTVKEAKEYLKRKGIRVRL